MGQHSFKPRRITVNGRISQAEALASMTRLLNDYADPAMLKAALEELPDEARQKAVMTELMATQVVHQLSAMVAKALSEMLESWGYTVEQLDAVSEELMDDIAEEAEEATAKNVPDDGNGIVGL